MYINQWLNRIPKYYWASLFEETMFKRVDASKEKDEKFYFENILQYVYVII